GMAATTCTPTLKESPPRVAVTVTGPSEARRPEAVTGAIVWPAGTQTESGTARIWGAALDSMTVRPPSGAGMSRVTCRSGVGTTLAAPSSTNVSAGPKAARRAGSGVISTAHVAL